METRIIPFEQTAITFTIGDSVMVNATDMAKAFGKRPAEWQRLPSTLDFLTAYEAMGKSHRSEAIRTEVGVGTWFHEDIALEFARWLSPAFAIWCNDRIKELLTTGRTEIREKTEDEKLFEAFGILNGRVALLEANNHLLNDQLKDANKTIELQAPQVQYATTVLNSADLIRVDDIASQLGISATKLNKWLEEKGVQYKRPGGTWYLHSQHRDKGWARHVTNTYKDTQGVEHSKEFLKWTQAGKRAIIETWQKEKVKTAA